MGKSSDQDQASHGGGKRSAESQSSDANELGRDEAGKLTSADNERGRMEKGARVGPDSDPDDLSDADVKRRAGAATRAPAEGA